MLESINFSSFSANPLLSGSSLTTSTLLQLPVAASAAPGFRCGTTAPEASTASATSSVFTMPNFGSSFVNTLLQPLDHSGRDNIGIGSRQRSENPLLSREPSALSVYDDMSVSHDLSSSFSVEKDHAVFSGSFGFGGAEPIGAGFSAKMEVEMEEPEFEIVKPKMRMQAGYRDGAFAMKPVTEQFEANFLIACTVPLLVLFSTHSIR